MKESLEAISISVPIPSRWPSDDDFCVRELWQLISGVFFQWFTTSRVATV